MSYHKKLKFEKEYFRKKEVESFRKRKLDHPDWWTLKSTKRSYYLKMKPYKQIKEEGIKKGTIIKRR